ncbi:MAG: VWA domain-containing protein, partial [Acidobacteria bacterium]|nr:VWA domain-containing protein [Acidobacteriota bacterium]
MIRLAGLALLTATLWGQATFRTTTQLVVETVTVKDKNGRPVTGLTAKDFVLTEDGVAQEIKFFEFQKLAEPVAAPPVAGPVESLARLTRGDIAGGDVRYRDKRLLALYFDLTAMPGPDQVRAFRAAKIFVQRQMTSADLVAVMVCQGGSVRVLHHFTEDRGRLLRVSETLLVGEDENVPVDPAT